ncbi:MAG: toll/interleukin-1 receptor domain-containing protein [Candidatus Saccharimonas sp.]|nr:toll/interleukin-1 receptor domain-containing protein [Planctomycetaceae bacterium]
MGRGEGFFEGGRISPEYAVFLSYSREDEGALTGTFNGIRSRGIPVFQDKKAIPGGANWPDVLYRSVRNCQVFLCMLSPQSAGSISVLIEVALARHAHRPIVPVLLQAVALPSAMRALLEGTQHIDLSGRVDSKEGLDELLNALAVYGLCPQRQR